MFMVMSLMVMSLMVIMIKFHVRLVRTEFLAWIKFNHLATRRRRLVDRLHHRVLVKGPRLTANRNAARQAAFGDRSGQQVQARKTKRGRQKKRWDFHAKLDNGSGRPDNAIQSRAKS